MSNTTITSELAENEKKEKSVSDNISLFQSLRVLQEGEGEDSYSSSTRSNYIIRFSFSAPSHDLNHMLCLAMRTSIQLKWRNQNQFIVAGLKEPNETCMKTSILSSFVMASLILLFILVGTLWMTCSKLRYRNKDAGLYNAYINHKGQIDWVTSLLG